MRFKMDFSKLPKCGAKPKIKSTRSRPCRHIALKNGRCYLHGGRNLIKHGRFTKLAKQERTLRRLMINEAKHILKKLDNIINETK